MKKAYKKNAHTRNFDNRLIYLQLSNSKMYLFQILSPKINTKAEKQLIYPRFQEINKGNFQFHFVSNFLFTAPDCCSIPIMLANCNGSIREPATHQADEIDIWS